MSYQDRPPPPKGPPWAHNSLGASIHNALAGWWRLPLAQRTVTAAGTLLDRGWIDEGFRPARPSRQGSASEPSPWWRAMSPDSIRLTSRSAWNGPWRPARTRSRSPAGSTVSTRGQPRPQGRGLQRAGRRHGNRARGRGLQDRAAPAHHGRRAQLDGPGAVRAGRRASAAAAVSPGGTAPPAHRRGPRVVSTPINRWPGTWAARRISPRNARQPMNGCVTACPADRYDEVFPPRPGPSCGWCDYRRHCPEGAAAASAQHPWDGLSADRDPRDSQRG